MTVLDEVLQAETLVATKIAEATTVAAEQVATAKAAHTDAVEAEKVRLAEVEVDTLAAHANTVQTNSEAITTAATKDVTVIKAAYEAKAADLTKKISDAIA